MMGRSPTHAGVLSRRGRTRALVRSRSSEQRARGVAVVESFGTYVAQIAEVSSGEGDGPRVHKVWCAVDCGIAVNPRRHPRADGERHRLRIGGTSSLPSVALDEGRPVQKQLRHLSFSAYPRECRRSRSGSVNSRRETDRRRRTGPCPDRPRLRTPWRVWGCSGHAVCRWLRGVV